MLSTNAIRRYLTVIDDKGGYILLWHPEVDSKGYAIPGTMTVGKAYRWLFVCHYCNTTTGQHTC